MSDEREAEFFDTIISNPNIPEDIRKRASQIRGNTNGEGWKADVWIYRAVIVVLGTAVVATVLGGLGLAAVGSDNYKLPAEIVAIGSAAVGALAGLLAPSPRERN